MANEMDKLIWRVLDGKASPGEVRRVVEWVREPGNRKYFRQLRKVWNLVNGPRVTPERKREELERFRNFMRQQPGGKERRFVRRMGWYKYAAVVFIPVLIVVYFLNFLISQITAMQTTAIIAPIANPPKSILVCSHFVSSRSTG